MRKRYIDFVPTKSNSVTGGQKTSVRSKQTTWTGVLMPNDGRRVVRGNYVVARRATSIGAPNVLNRGSTSVQMVMPQKQIPNRGGASVRTAASQGRVLGSSGGARKDSQSNDRVIIGSDKIKRPGAPSGVTQVKTRVVAASAKVVSDSGAPVLGVIEETGVKFVSTDVSKRPLGDPSHFKERKAGISAIKAKKVGMGAAVKEKASTMRPIGARATAANGRGKARPGVAMGVVGSKAMAETDKARTGVETQKATSSSASQNRMTIAKKDKHSTYQMPKSPFINQSKVQKRPLSKNVYSKKVPVSKKEPSGPVTIISNSDKSSRVGLIVTIVLTIVLGAAAGAIAFLFLPK